MMDGYYILRDVQCAACKGKGWIEMSNEVKTIGFTCGQCVGAKFFVEKCPITAEAARELLRREGESSKNV